ncbi:MAG: methylenetetrahydrofolate reductase [Dehalococcoidia bacterium]
MGSSSSSVPAGIESPFERALTDGRFVLTAELESPRGASAANVERQARAYAPLVDAVNCTDNSAAVARMSPVAAAAIAARSGLTPLVQLTSRDRNRLAVQSEILGAAAVGAAGVVCMWGDPPQTGNHPDAKGVYDLDTLDLLRAVRSLVDGRFLSGDRVFSPPRLLPGAVVTPADSDAAVENLRGKVEAGAVFVQTQIGYDMTQFAAWMHRVRADGLHERVKILAGVAPIRRLSIARYLAEHVPGVTVPDVVMQRLERAGDVEREGVAVAAEHLRTVQAIEGVSGAHIMTFGWVEGVRRVVEAAGLAGGRRA